MDSLFREYANPIFLIDHLLSVHQFSAWVIAQAENENDRLMWEYYVHKLGAWDSRSYDDFRRDITKGVPTRVNVPTKDQQIATIRNSKEIITGFEITQEGG